MQITLLLRARAGHAGSDRKWGGTGLRLAMVDGGHTPHVQSHHLMPGFIAASFNYHQTRRVELGGVTMLTMSPVIAWHWHTCQHSHTFLSHVTAPCFLCPEQSCVVTQFLLILPHHCKNMKHAHHLFMARVCRCRDIWDRGRGLIVCSQPRVWDEEVTSMSSSRSSSLPSPMSSSEVWRGPVSGTQDKDTLA